MKTGEWWLITQRPLAKRANHENIRDTLDGDAGVLWDLKTEGVAGLSEAVSPAKQSMDEKSNHDDIHETERYYDNRAGEYEAIYYRPQGDRRLELDRVTRFMTGAMAGRRVLEIAAGTGYWCSSKACTDTSVKDREW